MSAQPARRELHLRRIELRAFARDDGLWDVEAHLRDEKPYAYIDAGRGAREPGDPVHDLHVRLTFDEDRIVRDVDVKMGSMPFGTCREAEGSLKVLIGERIGPGWRAILKKIPRNATCTHAKELLMPMATAVVQGMALGREPDGKTSAVRDTERKDAPFYVDDCHSWRADGPQVAKYFPQFIRKRDA